MKKKHKIDLSGIFNFIYKLIYLYRIVHYKLVRLHYNNLFYIGIGSSFATNTKI